MTSTQIHEPTEFARFEVTATQRNAPDREDSYQGNGRKGQNVASTERAVSVAAGSILALLGLRRRDPLGLLVAAVGGSLVYRGATGHCHVYQALGVDTAQQAKEASRGFEVRESLLNDKSPEEL
jgi:uncharacterized membrane protein